MDELARTHDIAYAKSNLTSDREKADAILEDRAWENFKSPKTGLQEKAASWLVTTAMKVKRKLGAGCRFKCAVSAAKKSMKNKKGESDVKKLAKTCVVAAKKAISRKKKTKTPRIIPIPRKGGVLPLIPIFAGLSALGSLTGGIASVVKTVNDMRSNRDKPIHLGKGLYLTPYKNNTYQIKKGDGLYLAPYKTGGGSMKKKNSRKSTRKPSKN